MAEHKRQAPNATFDELRGRYYGSDKEKRQALVDEISDDKQVQRGVTVTQPVDFEQPGRIVGRRRARLMFSGDE